MLHEGPPARHQWILHTPYREPDRHWALDEHGRALDRTWPGRRPSSTQLPVPNPKGGAVDWKEPDASVEPHGTINEIREHVRAWRDANWPGVHSRVLHLLEYWAREGVGMRPFWCQREAVETLIWLFDAGRSNAPVEHAAILRKLEQANGDWNESIPRVALKMATGTGKTLLMAMIALWWTVRHPGGPVEFLALTPGRTIRERLRVLSDKGSAVWKSAAPRGFESDLRRMRWTVLNFQSFQRQTALGVGGKQATTKEKELLVGKGAEEPASWRESATEMLARLLKEHRGGGRITVINDEAHHCYTLRGVAVSKRKEDPDEREDRKRAELWFGALRALRDAGLLEQVFDLSATPMWLRRPARLEAETFPWTVSDFSLLDAVESGLVKVPRVPVDDRLVEDGQPVHLHPRFRNVYLHNQKRLIGETLTPEVSEPLRQLYGHYCETFQAYAEKDRIPVMIAVANSIENATALHRYIAGYRDGSIWKAGNLDLFSNSDPASGLPRAHPPTVLVHSRMDDSGSGQGSKIARAIAEQASLFAPEAKTSDEKRQAIDSVFMTVGQKDEPGERIRCVISVGMLTEGWDTRTVTHVFGYRAFRSQLLCEQVAGRALRKTAFTAADEIQPIEYANLFGVPFAWLGGHAINGPPPPPADETVCTVPGREKFRLFFPHVAGYAPSGGVLRWEVDVSRLHGYKVQRQQRVTTEVGGAVGGELEIEAESASPHRALWQAAEQLVPRLDGGPDHRRQAFLCSVRIVRESLWVMDCETWSDLHHDTDTLDLIATHVRRIEGEPFVAPVFIDQADPGTPRTSDTSGVEFRTVLRHWYPKERSVLPAKSELSAAACHTYSEALLAEILDTHPDIHSWVRNFHLGWRVPWFDAQRGGTAMMEPDFVARSKLPTARGRERYLVIEFKGLLAGQASELAKQKYLEEYWAPAVSSRTDAAGDLGDWQVVWIEDIGKARDLIATACRRKEWA